MTSINTLERRVKELEEAHMPRRQTVVCWIRANATQEERDAARRERLAALGFTEDQVETFVFLRWFSEGEPLPHPARDIAADFPHSKILKGE